MHYHDWRWDLKRYFFLNWVVLEEVGGEGTPFQKFAEEEVYFFFLMFVPYKVIILQATFAFKRVWNDLSTFSLLYLEDIKKGVTSWFWSRHQEYFNLSRESSH